MHVNDALTSQKVAGTPSTVQQSTGQQAGTTPAESVSTHTSAPELQDVLNALRQIPQVREELVREVAQRLAGGHYSKPNTPERTVQSILGSGST
jgi:hypothetical protein